MVKYLSMVIFNTLLFTHVVGEVKLALERSEGMVKRQNGKTARGQGGKRAIAI